MSTDLPKTYSAQQVEKRWYDFWEKHECFRADPSSEKPPYCIVLPPPNVTGVLHMGHALGSTIDDVLVRWKRMSGFEVLWVPGTDHAGIATQTVVERHLMKTQGKRRGDFKREAFLKLVWEWKEKNEGRILSQLKKLGCSCDWSRLRFTMDKGNNLAVRTAFKMLYEKGLIYRGDYLVNWDPVTQTAVADDEVEYEERQSSLWFFNYPLTDGSGMARIATTRPETMLGDTAVAVNPEDPMFKHLIGKRLLLPIMNREIPIIADRHVDPEFGTGMVKVTPAHDPNDYEMGIEHKLPFINIMTPDGKINENGGKFEGMAMEQARKAVVEEMEQLGYLEKVEPYTNRVGVSYRSKATIEPYLSKQWFVKMSHFAPRLREIVQEEIVSLIPRNWQNTYFHWIDNLRDWCISRQLWWGHRIPIWYHKDNPDRVICYEGDGTPPEVEAEPDKWEQDPDVLDTWFSSALWPFSTLGWPNKTEELEKFYPNSAMVCGHDILFFWVARMIMMGEHLFEKAPFPEVYLHSLIFGKSYWRKDAGGGVQYCDEKERIAFDLGTKPVPKDVESKWEKMSKSKGNIIDPLEIIEDYGTDAMRMALCSSASQAWQIDLDRRKFEEFKNFANKIWNGARFIFMNLDANDPLNSKQLSEGLDESRLTLEDQWILSSLSKTVEDVNFNLSNYQFDQAATRAYDFYWNEFCAYYLEIAKPVLFGKQGSPEERKNKQKLLVIVLLQALRLIHPMAPFITEELFQKIKERFADTAEDADADPYTKEAVAALQAKACIIAPYPKVIKPEAMSSQINHAFNLMGQVVYTIRNIRGEMKIPPSVETEVFIIGNDQSTNFSTVRDNGNIIEALVRTRSLSCYVEEPLIGLSSVGIVEDLKVIIPMPKEFSEKEAIRLEKERERLEKQQEKIQGQLANENFVSKAPKALIEKTRSQLEQTENELKEVNAKLKTLR
ncbi:Valyl-tRNA synthetase [Waddlia chondrophila 2032/99]|uniref:Valine--tRNA ligase n=1 Tax=Waddlia chondrophila 2032/99 TaxID=765953 RepID=F8LBN5_9BACT|nr:Valyl-tRNA synthetase [Waddlia chondrophila 2032/99]